MYGCQQVLIKANKKVCALEYLCGESNKVYNCAVYYGRQIWFKTKRIVTGFELTAELKSNHHFKAGYASSMQQTCLSVGEAFKSFKKLLSAAKKGELEHKPLAPKYRNSGGLFTVTYPRRWLKISDGLIRCHRTLSGNRLRKFAFYPETVSFTHSFVGLEPRLCQIGSDATQLCASLTN